MKKNIIAFLRVLATPFYSFEKKKIKTGVIVLNVISVALLITFIRVVNYIMKTATNASECASSVAIVFSAFLGAFIPMIISINSANKSDADKILATMNQTQQNHPAVNTATNVAQKIVKKVTAGRKKKTETKPAQVLK